jgi:hypothetical protein
VAKSVLEVSSPVAKASAAALISDCAWARATDGEKLPAQVVGFGPAIPKGAKKVAAAKEFINYVQTWVHHRPLGPAAEDAGWLDTLDAPTPRSLATLSFQLFGSSSTCFLM